MSNTEIKKSKKVIGPLLLLSAAMIWGLSFVLQKQGMESIGPFTFNSTRLAIATAALLPVAIIGGKKNAPAVPVSAEEKKVARKKELKGMLIVGICLFVGLNLQQAAFIYLEAGKVGFITALYMILVPIFGLFMKKRPSAVIWLGVLMATVGLYLICIGGKADFRLGTGEILTLLCAVGFALHIISIDKFAGEVDSVRLSCGQFFVAAVLSTICMFIFEKPDMPSIMQAAIPILYAGVMSSSVAFTFQIIGQKYTEPTIASMLLCLESVFSVIFSYFLTPDQQLKPSEYIGCAVMFVAILLAQIPPKKKTE